MNQTATITGEATQRFNELLREKINTHLARQKQRNEKASWRQFIIDNATVTVVQHTQLRSLHDAPESPSRMTIPSTPAVPALTLLEVVPSGRTTVPASPAAHASPFLQLFNDEAIEASNDDDDEIEIEIDVEFPHERNITASRNALLSLAILLLLLNGIFLVIALG